VEVSREVQVAQHRLTASVHPVKDTHSARLSAGACWLYDDGRAHLTVRVQDRTLLKASQDSVMAQLRGAAKQDKHLFDP
jgi:hypothetical protein